MAKKIVKTNLALILLVLAGFMGYGMFASAGDLNPNSSPGPTMKTLQDVEPRTAINVINTPGDGSYKFIISSPGSYYMTGSVASNVSCIKVDADNVTIDLMGFRLSETGIGVTTGIHLDTCKNVEIRNGTVSGFDYGIHDPGFLGEDYRIINVRSVFNTLSGIVLLGSGHLIKDCTVCNNGFEASEINSGITIGNDSSMIDNIVRFNGTDATGGAVFGIVANYGCTVRGNIVNRNGTSAEVDVHGIYVSNGCMITGNTVSTNGASASGSFVRGIYVNGDGCTVISNTVYSNGGSASGIVYGINLTGNSFAAQNTAFGNNGTNMNKPASCSFGWNHTP